MYFLFSVMVCGYKCSCLRNLTPVMSGCHLLDHLPSYQVTLFRMARKKSRGQGRGRGDWKGDVVVCGPASHLQVSACCLFQTGSFHHRCLGFSCFLFVFWGGIFVAEGEALQWDSSSVTIESQ